MKVQGKMGFFKLEIDLGNDAMQTPLDIARVLEKVARNLKVPVIAEQEESHQTLYDSNGNAVGAWELCLPEE